MLSETGTRQPPGDYKVLAAEAGSGAHSGAAAGAEPTRVLGEAHLRP